MPVYDTSVTVPHAPENMFDLVSNIARYPEFIRWIQTMRVTQDRHDGAVRHCVGAAKVGFRGFSEDFTTSVAADSRNLTVQADLVRGPFRRLHNFWTFVQLEDGRTRIDFHIDYEFSNIVLRLLAKANFGLAVDKIMGAFLAEADRRYERVT